MNPIYMNPHPQQTQQRYMPPQQPQRYMQPAMVQQQQPMQQMQNTGQYQMVMTNYGPRIVDVTTGQFVDQQPMQQMQQMPQQQQRNFQQPSPRLMMGNSQPVYQTDSGPDDNRFDQPQRQLIQPQTQDTSAMRIPNQPNTTVVIEHPKFVPGKKLLKSKSASFFPRTRPFTEAEIHSVNLVVIDGGFSSAAEELYSEAYNQPEAKNKTAIVANCVLGEVFHDTSLFGAIDELYQSDIESVYRFLRQAVDGLTTRPDIVFISEYNQWLTDQVNDILSIAAKGYAIESFVEDFNDLKLAMGDAVTMDGSGKIYDRLTYNMRNAMATAMKFYKESLKDKDPEGMYLVESDTLVFVKLLSTELFPDGVPDNEVDGNRLISSLFDHTRSDRFYLMTVDKVIYKVINDLDKMVHVQIVGN